ncbi:MAG TPA: cysteine--tRNA ligase [Anaerolineae bacterium]|jgi:L-cysteine:1D-myo-inositol 2-amino-2-deoxy-alpha-D-glucopyranoside ligase|nr:cysteine--tRNA ligase [Anaerolineae bacterium]
MQLYNVLTRQLEAFEPAGDPVTVYVCGITPYDTTHLGHCFTYASFDVLIRYLEFLGRDVRYAQNVTDIDDDILRRAREVGDDWLALGNRWTTHFIDDSHALNILPPDHFPRATDVIDGILTAVQDLLTSGVAYESNGSVYFHVASDPEYGKLSRLPYDEMLPIANERGNRPDDPNKRDPLDFVLWQAEADGEPAWESPWGSGRPGWHIECSTMSAKLLGRPIDIHGGGADLIFPHHESEIAQAECGSGEGPFSRYWMHIAMVRYQGEKMSKSLGNLVMIRDLLQAGFHPDAIRLCMVAHHYRQPWTYEDADIERSAEIAENLRRAVTASSGEGQAMDPALAQVAFRAAMDDDLDTPAALDIMIQLADDILLSAEEGGDVSWGQKALREMSGIMGLRLDADRPEERVVEGWRRHKQRFAGVE